MASALLASPVAACPALLLRLTVGEEAGEEDARDAEGLEPHQLQDVGRNQARQQVVDREVGVPSLARACVGGAAAAAAAADQSAARAGCTAAPASRTRSTAA